MTRIKYATESKPANLDVGLLTLTKRGLRLASDIVELNDHELIKTENGIDVAVERKRWTLDGRQFPWIDSETNPGEIVSALREVFAVALALRSERLQVSDRA